MTIRKITNLLALLLALAGCVVATVLTYEEYHPAADIGCSKMGGDCARTIKSSYGHLGPIPTSLFGLAMYLTVAGLCVARHRALQTRQIAVKGFAQSGMPASEDSGAGAQAAKEELEAALGGEPAGSPSGDGAQSSAGTPPGNSARPAGWTDSALDDPSPLLSINAALRRLDAGVWFIATAAVLISWWLQNASLYELCSFCPWCFGSAALVTLIFLLSSYDFLISGRRLDGEQRLLAGISAFIVVCFAIVATPVVLDRIRVCGSIKPEAPTPPVDLTPQRDLIVLNRLHFKGDPKAKFALVEFGDFQCSHCKKAVPIVEGLLKSPPEGGVRFAFRHFPLPRHTWSMPAAKATEAAGEQGKFWEMRDLIYEKQEEMDKPGFVRENFDAWAESLHLDPTRFTKDFDDLKMLERIKSDQDAATATGLELTPSFYLVTPTQVTRFTGVEDLEKMWRDPKSRFWK